MICLTALLLQATQEMRYILLWHQYKWRKSVRLKHCHKGNVDWILVEFEARILGLLKDGLRLSPGLIKAK